VSCCDGAEAQWPNGATVLWFKIKKMKDHDDK